MPRKKTTPAAKPDAILPDELLEKLIPGPMDAAGVEAVFQKLKKAVIERALGAELGVHLARPEGGRGNHRNGRSGKTVLTDDGPLRIEVPRDRAGSFEPQLIPKHERRFAGFDDRIISSWFDWDWVCALAEARPDDEIRLIGPVFDSSTRKLPGNINLLPACDHAVALKAMAEFHVGLIPFKKNALTASVDPIKYYEYRALGLPVISTDFGEMSLRAGERGVFITQSVSDAPAMADSAIQFCGDAGDASAFAIQNTWEARFDAANLLP